MVDFDRRWLLLGGNGLFRSSQVVMVDFDCRQSISGGIYRGRKKKREPRVRHYSPDPDPSLISDFFSPRFRRQVIGSSLGVRRKNENFADRLSEIRREFTGRMLEVHWEFIEGNRELAGGSSERCREFAEETIGQ
ncbi:hypothetical protein GW17_00049953 [Ensete ventricosum]|nr:hypothetical protein GW17_00049953 [Ensete ventricosum]